MKITLPIAASAGILVLAIALTGCSAGGLPGSSSSGSSSGSTAAAGNGSGGSSNSGPTRDYSADDLVAILKKTEAARNLSGTIKDNAQIKSDGVAKPGESLTKSFAASGGKFEPAACGAFLDSLLDEADKSLSDSGWTGASLSASTDVISIASAASGSDVSGIVADTKNIMSKLTSQCSKMTIVAGSVSINFTMTNIAASSNANETFGYEEDIAVPGEATEKSLTLEAVYGNLYIGDISITGANLSHMEANVNAVIDAAKG